jgi:hypothetical protein
LALLGDCFCFSLCFRSQDDDDEDEDQLEHPQQDAHVPSAPSSSVAVPTAEEVAPSTAAPQTPIPRALSPFDIAQEPETETSSSSSASTDTTIAFLDDSARQTRPMLMGEEGLQMGRASPLFITVDSPSSPWASEAGTSPAASIGTPTADENEDEEEEEDVEVEEEEKKEEEGEEDLHPPAEEEQQQVKKTISSRRRNRRQRYIKLLKEEGHYIKPDVERRRKKRRRSSSTSSGSSNGNDIQGHSRTISIDSSSISSTSSPTIIPEEEEEKAVEREVKLLARKKDIFGADPLDALMHGTLSIKGKVQKLVEKHICSYAGHGASSNYQHDGVLGEGAFAPVVVVGKRGGYGNQELALKMIKLVEKNASKAEQNKAVRRAVLEAEALYLLRGRRGRFKWWG